MAATFAEAMIRFTADGGGLSRQLSGIEKAVGDSADRMASMVKRAMLELGTAIAAIAAPAALFEMIKSSAEAGEALEKMSQRVAISVETLSGYKLAGDLAGVSMEEFGTALQRASKNIVDASHYTGEAVDALDALGIRVTDNNGKLKTAEQVMLEVADRFMGMEDGARKTAMAIEIFGRSGANMIPMLNQGSAALAAQRKESDLLGGTWTTAQAKIAEEFTGLLQRVATGLAGFRDEIAGYLLPFANEVLGSIVEKMKEWAANGDLKKWAMSTAEFIIEAMVKAAEGVATIAQAAGLIVDVFRIVNMTIRTIESGFEAFISMIAKNVEWLFRGLVRIAELIHDPWVDSYRDIERAAKDWGETAWTASKQAADAAVASGNAIGSSTEMADKFAGTVKGLAGQFRDWAGAAMKAGSDAAAGIGKAGEGAKKVAGDVQTVLEYQVDGVTRYMTVWTKAIQQGMDQTAKEQRTAMEASFRALKTRGDVSLEDELAYLQKRAQLFTQHTPERNQAEAEAFKFAKDLATQLFEHQKTMGLKSLQQEIDFQKQKAVAAVAGSAERMKAEEDVFKKEEDLRNKRQSAALGIIGEAKDWLERTGRGTENVSAADVQMAIDAVQQERSMNVLRTQGWAAGGGLMSIEDITKGYESAGKLNAANVMQRELGTPEGILQGGAEVGAGPVAGSIVGIGSLVTSKWTDAMGTIKTASDEAFGYIEKRAETATSNIATSIYNNLEDWFVRKLMDQAARS